MKVKICGLTKKEDALYAATLGADAVGIVNVKESKRFVTLEQAKKIFEAFPLFISKVLVASPKDLKELKEIEETGANYIQLHGEETLEFVKQIRDNTTLGIIKQIPVSDESSIALAKSYEQYVDAILLDSAVKGVLGGTGATHDWNVSRRIVSEIKKPVILAGGLTPENVTDAIKKVSPYAVDVASGVEKSPGIKDKKKIQEFILNVRRYEISVAGLIDPLESAGMLGKEQGLESTKELVLRYKGNEKVI